jgi:uncharacterized protein YndB with AHSA1/START domain
VSLTVSTPSDTEILLTRAFAAAPERLFDAWTRPELLVRWYGARGWNLVVCEVDLRVGGTWRFVSAGPGGETMVQSGVYRQIEPPRLLVYTEVFADQSYEGETLVSHRFEAAGGTAPRTTVTSTLRYATRQARDRVLSYPMERGLGEGYDRLTSLLEGNPS